MLVLCLLGHAAYAADGLKVASITTRMDSKEGLITDVKVRVENGYNFSGEAYYEIQFAGSVAIVQNEKGRFAKVFANADRTLLGWNLHLGSNINEIIIIARNMDGDVQIFHRPSEELAAFFRARGVEPVRLLLDGIDGNRLHIYYDPQGGQEKHFDFQAEIKNGRLCLCPGSVQEDD